MIRSVGRALPLFVGTVIVALFWVPAAAQDSAPEAPDSSDYRLDEIVIEAARPITTIGGASGIKVPMESLGLPAAPTVEQALRELPLLHVRTNSRGEAEISARGSESRQVAVLVDGIPITLAWDARADVCVIPATASKEIVYLRGLSSMLYGPNVLGGVIETSVGRTLDQPRDRSFQVTSGTDDVGSFGGTLTGEIPFERFGGQGFLRGGLGYRTTPGQPLARKIVEPLPGDDGLRLNTDAQSLDGFLALRHRTRDGAWVSISGTAFREDRGIAAELGLADEDARLWRYPHVSRNLAVVSAGTGDRSSPLGGRGDIEASLGFDTGLTKIDSYTSRAYEIRNGFEHGKDRTLTLRLLGDQSIGRRGRLKGAFTLSEIRHEEALGTIDESGTAVSRATYRQRLWSAGGESDWRLLGPGRRGTSLTASVGGAYDVGATPESGGRTPRQGRLSEVGGRAGLSLSLAGDRTVLHAGISRRGRFPALRELYSGALHRFAPNPDLKPERLTAAEAGVTTRVAKGRVQLVGFHHLLKDAVVRISLEDRRFMRVNRNELESTGVELLASQNLGEVSFSGDLTVQDVKLTDTAAEETHKPENLPEVFGSLGLHFPLFLGAQGGARLDYTGGQSAIDPGTGEDAELASGTLLGGYVTRVWSLRPAGWIFSGMETRLSVDNATDFALYDGAGLPDAGRRFRFEVRLF
jgi:iron complex outermembrane receptor protein